MHEVSGKFFFVYKVQVQIKTNQVDHCYIEMSYVTNNKQVVHFVTTVEIHK